MRSDSGLAANLDAGADAGSRRDALHRLLVSRTLANRLRLRQFLDFVGQEALAGRAAELKEQALAVAVFGRHSGHISGDDNIVRVTARQLRSKIDEYYLTEGKDDPWRVQIPRGTYAPLFVRAADLPPLSPSPQTATAPPPARWRRRAGWLAAAMSTSALALVLATGWRPHSAPSPPPMTVLRLLQPRPERRVIIVCADAAVQMYKVVTGRAVTLADYQRQAYLRESGKMLHDAKALEWIENAQLFGIGNVSALAKLVPAFPPGTVTVRHPRQVTDREFVDDNVILLSGPFANPWVQLFEGRLNFQVTEETDGTVYIRDLHPAPGEQPEYRAADRNGRRHTYCRMALVPNLSGRGHVLLIGGPSSSLIEVLSSSLSDPAFYHELQDRLGVARTAQVPFFEILAEVTEVGRAPVSVHLLAARRAN